MCVNITNFISIETLKEILREIVVCMQPSALIDWSILELDEDGFGKFDFRGNNNSLKCLIILYQSPWKLCLDRSQLPAKEELTQLIVVVV
jgi:hypothetical protein